MHGISTGNYTSGALTAAGGVACWDSYNFFSISDGSELTSGISQIAAGGNHVCVLTTGGGVKCWGSNEDGQVGDGTTVYQGAPVDVVGLTSGVSAISAGNSHTCALTSSGAVKCWGRNSVGQLGDGTRVSRSTPVSVVQMTSGVTAISTGYDHTCAVIGGAAKCWGNNTRGQLGNGMTTLRLTPIDVVGMQGDSSVDLSIDSITPVQALESQAFVKDKRTALKVVVRKRGYGSAKGVTARVAYNSNFYTDFCVGEGDNIDQTTHTLKKNYAGCSCQAKTGSASLLVTSCCLWWLKTPSVRNLTPTGR